MYYNPTTQEQKSLDDLKVMFNSSFPKDIEEVNGWFRLENTSPDHTPDQKVIKGGIELVDGVYTQIYTLEEVSDQVKKQRELREKREELDRSLENYKYVFEEIVLGLATQEDYKEEIDEIARLHNELYILEND